MNNKAPRVDSFYRWLPTVPIVVLIAMFIVASWSWQRQERRLQAESAKLFEGPADRSSTQFTDRWLRILRSCERLSGTYQLLSVAINMNPNGQWVVSPDDPFILEPIVDQYVQDAAAILSALKPLVESDQEIWIPTVHDPDGVDYSALGETRGVARLLAMEFVSAFHDGDNERALFAIHAIDRIFRVPNQPRPMVVEMVRQACHTTGLTLVRQSMQYDHWSDAEIEQLEAFVDRTGPFEDIWRSTLQGEMQFMQNKIGQDFFGPGSMAQQSMTIAPSQETELLKQFETIQMNLGQVGTVKFVQSLDRQEGNSKANPSSTDIWLCVPSMNNIWNAMSYSGSLSSFAHSLARHQASIRLTIISIAARKYHRTNGQWPNSLSDFSAVGLPLSETLDPSGNPMEMRVTGEGNLQLKFKDYPEPSVGYYSVQYLDTVECRP